MKSSLWGCAALLVAGTGAALAQNETITVTGNRLDLLGTAATSSQGVVTQDELALLPAYRPGQLLETVPGLVVTAHSGEGKANQYLLRGFNLDHGTDLATFVDGMPVNEPTNAHGQGYTDLNFLIPELAAGVDFTKGPYFAAQGDFAGVGSIHMRYADQLPNQISATAGTLGFQRLFASGSTAFSNGTLLAAGEVVHYDGPWVHADNQRKLNAILRYSEGDAANGFSLTAMYYRGLWNATTDQPERAVTSGLIDRFGTLDPSDGGTAQRMSLSSQYHRSLGDGFLEMNAYAISNRFTLINDFTHFLDDPVNGDQEAQTEVRDTFGGAINYERSDTFLGFGNDVQAGAQFRYDAVHVYRSFTKARVFLSSAEDDFAKVGNIAGYVQATTHWTPWLRSVIGVRADYFAETDTGTNGGSADDNFLQPKVSLAITPWQNTEFYVSAGQGFHTDDVRGVNQAATLSLTGAPLIAKQTGAEVGMRSTILPNLTATLTAFSLTSQSETTYDPDAGQDSAGPGSRRMGIELNTTYQAFTWLEFYTSLAASHARYTTPSDDGNGGHIGTHIPNAPSVIASFAAYVKDLGPWSGGAEFRYLGGFPLTPDNTIKGKGYGEWNIDGAYAFDNGWKIGVGIYNLLDTHANAAEFYYVDRLPGEPAGGTGDIHFHPLEPRTVRFTLTKAFN